MFKLIKKPIVIILIIVVIGVAIGGYFYYKKSQKKPYETISVKKGNLIQEVSVTGKISPAESVDLAFEKGGRVTAVNTNVGSKVESGQVLVYLYNADLVAQLAQARADLKVQQVKLDEILKGTREEEIQVQEVKVSNAKVALEETKKNLVDKIQDVYTKSDDAVRNKMDQLFSNPRTSSPQLNFLVNDSQLERDIEWQRFLVEGILNSWLIAIEKLTIISDFTLYINTAKENLNQIKFLSEKISLAVNDLQASSSFSQTTIDSWKNDVSTARTNINTAFTNLIAAEEKLKTAESNLLLEEKQLVFKKAGATQETINAQKAKIEQAEASIKNIQAQIEKTILCSPIKGLVTKKETKVGEIVAANTTIISIISENQFEIETFIAEADIAKVKVGNSASLTLDAYGSGEIFEAKVIKIDPAETVLEGVATYKTILHFAKEDKRVKPGMTANVDILTEKKENVLIIPQRAVITKNGDKFVRVPDPLISSGQGVKEIMIKTGLRGSDGNIEIIEGLKKGDRVIINLE